MNTDIIYDRTFDASCMKMERPSRTDIKDRKEFTFDGETLKMKECLDEDKHIYLFERYNKDGRLYAYELVKGIRVMNPDGSVVFAYPSTGQFGQYGYFITKNNVYGKKGIQYFFLKLAQMGKKS